MRLILKSNVFIWSPYAAFVDDNYVTNRNIRSLEGNNLRICEIRLIEIFLLINFTFNATLSNRLLQLIATLKGLVSLVKFKLSFHIDHELSYSVHDMLYLMKGDHYFQSLCFCLIVLFVRAEKESLDIICLSVRTSFILPSFFLLQLHTRRKTPFCRPNLFQLIYISVS